ncbi:MAG: hypothetical protein ACREOG_03520, partial [Gemmatimonadaceae bacterium]
MRRRVTKGERMLQALQDRVRAAFRSLPPVSPSQLVIAACWSGLVFGFAEGAIAIIRRRINHMPIGGHAWWELVWMPPLAAIIAFVLVAL